MFVRLRKTIDTIAFGCVRSTRSWIIGRVRVGMGPNRRTSGLQYISCAVIGAHSSGGWESSKLSGCWWPDKLTVRQHRVRGNFYSVVALLTRAGNCFECTLCLFLFGSVGRLYGIYCCRLELNLTSIKDGRTIYAMLLYWWTWQPFVSVQSTTGRAVWRQRLPIGKKQSAAWTTYTLF